MTLALQSPRRTPYVKGMQHETPSRPARRNSSAPSYTAARQARTMANCQAEKNARKALRAALTRYENARGRDELISALKIELEALGEEPRLLHSLAPTFDNKGQTSLLNIASGSPSIPPANQTRGVRRAVCV